MEKVLFVGTLGLNNKITPHRLPFGENGVAALEACENVLIDSTGELVTRRGLVTLESGDFHSGFSYQDHFYVIKNRDSDSALYKVIVNADDSIAMVGLRSGLSRAAKVYYTELNGRIYYQNGYDRGVLIEDVSYAWDEQDWTGPETTSDMLAMPAGTCLDILSGRMLCAVNDELFYSEYGLVNIVDTEKNRVRFSKITMICVVDGGTFISDDKGIYFLTGKNPNEWTATMVANYKAYDRAQGLYNPSFFGLETTSLCGVFATEKGQCVGLSDGSFFNLIDKNISLPVNCGSGAIMVVDETIILQS